MHCSVLQFNTLQLPWLTWDIYYIECNTEIQKYRTKEIQNIGDAQCTAASPADLACILGPAASIINLSASARPASKHTALHYSSTFCICVFRFLCFCIFVYFCMCVSAGPARKHIAPNYTSLHCNSSNIVAQKLCSKVAFYLETL